MSNYGSYEVGQKYVSEVPAIYPVITIHAVVDEWLMCAKPTGNPFLFTKKQFYHTFVIACKYKLKKPKSKDFEYKGIKVIWMDGVYNIWSEGWADSVSSAKAKIDEFYKPHK